MSTLNYNDQLLHQATETFRAIAHPIRLQIISLLQQHEWLAVKDIHEQLSIQQPVASHHLRIMKDKGIVANSRDGQSTRYKLTDSRFFDLVQTMEQLLD